MTSTLPITEHFRDALDAAQAADLRVDLAEEQEARDCLAEKNRRRRFARAVVQILLGQRMRHVGVEYTPELEQLHCDRGDGTLPSHYIFTLHGLSFALGAGDALVVSRAGAEWPHAYVWDRADFGRAVQALDGAR